MVRFPWRDDYVIIFVDVFVSFANPLGRFNTFIFSRRCITKHFDFVLFDEKNDGRFYIYSSSKTEKKRQKIQGSNIQIVHEILINRQFKKYIYTIL